MPPVEFEPTISGGERPQNYALDRAATGTSFMSVSKAEYKSKYFNFTSCLLGVKNVLCFQVPLLWASDLWCSQYHISLQNRTYQPSLPTRALTTFVGACLLENKTWGWEGYHQVTWPFCFMHDLYISSALILIHDWFQPTSMNMWTLL